MFTLLYLGLLNGRYFHLSVPFVVVFCITLIHDWGHDTNMHFQQSSFLFTCDIFMTLPRNSFILGGPGYAQLFTMVDPGDVALEPHRLSGNRTTLLSDLKADTCVSITNEINGRYLWIKVMPLHPYLFRGAFSVFITGRDLSCSPMDGISVAVQPACGINGTCNIAIPCVAQVPTQMGELNFCKYRCSTPVVWDFIAMHITRFWFNTNTLMELCEVWFSN